MRFHDEQNVVVALHTPEHDHVQVRRETAQNIARFIEADADNEHFDGKTTE